MKNEEIYLALVDYCETTDEFPMCRHFHLCLRITGNTDVESPSILKVLVGDRIMQVFKDRKVTITNVHITKLSDCYTLEV